MHPALHDHGGKTPVCARIARLERVHARGNFDRRLPRRSRVGFGEHSQLCALLGNRQKPVSVKGSSTITLSELRDLPAVFVGASTILGQPCCAKVRFKFAGSGELRSIQDSAHPASRGWGFEAPRVASVQGSREAPIFAGGFSNWGRKPPRLSSPPLIGCRRP